MRIRWFGLFALAALVGALWPTGAEAGKPSDGGGTGGGTIYFQTGGALWSMNSDGSGKAQLAVPTGSEPSRALHGGHRWYLQMRSVGGTYPDGWTRAEVFAVRGDANESFTRQLTDNADLQHRRSPCWTPGDAGISFIARQWSGSDVATGGIYRAAVQFDASGNVTGLAAQPTAPAVTIGLVLDNSTLWPNVAAHDWSPDESEVVHDRLGSQSLRDLRIVTVATATSRLLVSDGYYPMWSPDGGTIAYGRFGTTIWTVSPDGTGAGQILQASGWSRVQGPYGWSPTGSHLVYIRANTSTFVPVNDVYRATANGGGPSNLTKDVAESAGPTGWR